MDLRIESAQPEIIENDTDLLINFSITGSQMNGEETTDSLIVNFGNVGPNKSSVARWIMECSLSGKFVGLSADITHSDELGGRATSIIDENIKTHFLVQNVLVDLPGRDKILDFLALDEDAHMVYESESKEWPVLDMSPTSKLTYAGSDIVTKRYFYTMTSSTQSEGFI